MSLTPGDQDANTGMTKAIYDELLAALEPDLPDLSEAELEPIRDSWKKMAFAVATGVINHIRANMEIRGIQTQGNVTTTVNGNTGTAPPANHVHTVNLSGTATNVVLTQSNDGTGRVQ